jgi:Fe-S-cluster-containing dehydrogenase component/CRP-like cAMP-binding protein
MIIMTELEIAITRPQRWDVPFGRMKEHDVDWLLAIEPFRGIDATAFPPTLPLRGILMGDTRIGHYQAGDIVVREGDYGNSAFLVLSGSVRVILERLDPMLLGRNDPPRRGWLPAIAQLWQNSRVPEVRAGNGAHFATNGAGAREEDGTTRVFLQDFPRILDRTGTAQIGPGEIFGELAALSRTPRSATILADSPTTLLEIRWQGLRDLMRRTPTIREHIERAYRENSLRVHLRETPLLKNLPAAALDEVAGTTVFESYGNFDWYTDFGASRGGDAAEQIAAEPLIASEGDRATGLLLIRSGFARVSQRHGHGHRTIAYLGKGHIFGLEELAESFSNASDVTLRCSLRAVGYVDVLRIPVDVVKRVVLPHSDVQSLIPKVKQAGSSSTPDGSGDAPAHSDNIDSSLLDFLADHRFLNGTETMLINLDRCTRCDDCVRACAATHDNNPRFIRQGPTHDHIMVANACMHCVDPVCMIGCPTGAIARDSDTGTARINDRTCIGCAMCANSCPYQAIRMVEIRQSGGAFFIDAATQLPIVKATKCDLCASQLTGPACQAACPHDALVRMDLSNLAGLANWMSH